MRNHILGVLRNHFQSQNWVLGGQTVFVQDAQKLLERDLVQLKLLLGRGIVLLLSSLSLHLLFIFHLPNTPHILLPYGR